MSAYGVASGNVSPSRTAVAARTAACIAARYGSPEGAWAHSQRYGWY